MGRMYTFFFYITCHRIVSMSTDPTKCVLFCISFHNIFSKALVIPFVETNSTITPRHCDENFCLSAQYIYLILLLLFLCGTDLIRNSSKKNKNKKNNDSMFVRTRADRVYSTKMIITHMVHSCPPRQSQAM